MKKKLYFGLKLILFFIFIFTAKTFANDLETISNYLTCAKDAKELILSDLSASINNPEETNMTSGDQVTILRQYEKIVLNAIKILGYDKIFTNNHDRFYLGQAAVYLAFNANHHDQIATNANYNDPCKEHFLAVQQLLEQQKTETNPID